MTPNLPELFLEPIIYEFAGQRIMLDSDLAQLYDIETSQLNRACRRNLERFPNDFMLHLTPLERKDLTCQRGMSNLSATTGRGGSRKTCLAFTKEGVAMLSSVLRSDKAIQINILIMRKFASLDNHSKRDVSPEINPTKTDDKNHVQTLLEVVINSLTIQKRQNEDIQTILKSIFRQVVQNQQNVPEVAFLNKGRNLADIIQSAVAEYFQISISDLTSHDRSRSLSTPRQIAMYLVRKHTGMGFREIGDLFGSEDHTTILHAYHKIEDRIQKEFQLQALVKSIELQANLVSLSS